MDSHSGPITISRKKPSYPVREALRRYLRRYGREVELPVSYMELQEYSEAIPVLDREGKDTLWETALYPQGEMERIHNGLKKIYADLKAGGASHVQEHLFIERIDCCTFGNSKPFRIRIVNRYNDVYDYFYLKVPDASRIYGLELEHMLSPDSMSYLVDRETLVEEHIPGIPGDIFAQRYLHREDYNPKRIAKEFVKFNERCLLRLLGDMRAYNFVLDITPDFDDFRFRIRPIDFDQQCYEGSLKVYRPQFFKESFPYVELALKHFNEKVMLQYQQEERAALLQRMRSERTRLAFLREAMRTEVLSTPEKIAQLADELCSYYEDSRFSRATSMAELLEGSLKRLLRSGQHI
jgi:hypothetical protein